MPNNTVRASGEAMPEINRRRFLLNTTMAGAAVAVAAPVAAAEPEMTPLEEATWHMQEIERLIREDGGSYPTIIAVANYGDESGYRGCRGIRFCGEEGLHNDDGMFSAQPSSRQEAV